ncbi:MAG: VPLPA-CTERM sorting domain-containing protein [Gammaproteobacteria bacterium]
MKKSTIAAAVSLAIGIVGSVGAQAQLVNGSTTLKYINGNAGNFPTGALAGASWFSMQVGPTTTLYTGVQNGLDGGIKVGVAQTLPPGVVSHGGAPYGGTFTTDTGRIDTGWGFFGNTGMDFTINPTNVTSGGGNSGSTLDFTGWRVTWNTIPVINMGGGSQVVTGTKGTTTYNNGTGLATVTCSDASCSNGSTFTLDYSAVVPQKDPSGFGGVPYALHLTGTVSSVPVPAAAWLFGSGLVGLVGVARRKKV